MGWRRAGWAASATVRHSARQFDDDQNSRVLAAATTLDGYLAMPVATGIVAEVRAENVLDKRVEAGVSGANIIERGTPRTVWIGLKLSRP